MDTSLLFVPKSEPNNWHKTGMLADLKAHVLALCCLRQLRHDWHLGHRQLQLAFSLTLHMTEPGPQSQPNGDVHL